MKVYGLTGGIGSGKSTVARMLRQLGAVVVDADAIAREVVQPGSEGLRRVVEAFGADVLDADGALDRKRLGDRVFTDAAARARLNAITHPLIAETTARRMQALAQTGAPFAFYEAALLVDTGAYRGFDGLVVVEAAPATQRARVVARDRVGDEDATRRIDAQVDNAARRAAADVVLVNDADEEALFPAVKKLYERLRDGGSLRDPA